MFKSIAEFFGGIGHALLSVLSVVKKLVPNDQLLKGIELAEAAAGKFIDNAERRAWVVKELQHAFPMMPTYIANLIVELAVAHLKDAAKKAGDAASGAVLAPNG